MSADMTEGPVSDPRWEIFTNAEIKELSWLVGQGAEEYYADDYELALKLSRDLHWEYTIREGK